MNAFDTLCTNHANKVMPYYKWIAAGLDLHIPVSDIRAMIKDNRLIKAGQIIFIDKVNGCDMAPDDDYSDMIDYDADNDIYTFQVTQQLYKLADF